MANISKACLSDKDIELLEIKDKRYFAVVGNPKELEIYINPKGSKVFSVTVYDKYGKKHKCKLKEFRPGLYNAFKARRDAIKLLNNFDELGKDFNLLSETKKHTYKELFIKYMDKKIKIDGISKDYAKKITLVHEKYIIPAIGNKNIKEIKYEDLVEILNNIFNPNNPNKSRLETIYRLISVMKNVFAIAIKSRYIDYDPTFGLRDEYPSLASFYLKNNIDSRLPSLIDLDMIKEFIIDLKMDNKLDTQTKRAIYLQILSVNRPINTVSAKWEHIDLDKAIWTIPANEMKMRATHEIPLSKYMLKILNAQKLFCYDLKGYVFPALNTNGHLHRDTLSKAIRNLGSKNKYSGIATSHGFRATFRTICSRNKAELLNLGISEEAIESVLAHKELNVVKHSYEREKATIEQKAKLLEWYGDYLNSIEPLGF